MDLSTCGSDASSRRAYARHVQLLINNLIERTYSIDPDRMLLPTRGTRTVMLARHVAMYLSVIEGGLSHIETGRLFDRDRRSIAYALTRIEGCRDDDPGLDHTLDQLAAYLHRDLACHSTHLHGPHSRVPGSNLDQLP